MRKLTRYSTQMPPKAIRHSALRAFAQVIFVMSAGSPSASRRVENLFDTAVNRKVDGTFTDLTLHMTGSFG
ncbi:hypothetical protein BN2475_320029 [Paraburkholderia ribeironis]|uniref:Uncharacterized protein n=1 Tax=Paraburkholderia ribeironis TaxID=1247936 RepID=A0A1N7S478_9BURK|nr:hypothetical protein BN2475_320029 [Paraburkholderia ribeironis]